MPSRTSVPSGHTETIRAITVTHADGRTVAITDDRTIQWDLDTSAAGSHGIVTAGHGSRVATA